MTYFTDISRDTLLVSTKSNDQHIIDGTQIPGLSYPATTPTTLSSRRTSHKIAEQGRRNRINCALKELETLIPPMFIQDQQTQKLAASGVNASEKEEKGTHQAFGKAFIVETAIHYIKELRMCLTGSDNSAGTDAPVNLSSEHDLRKIPGQGPRNRINNALKEIESLIPPEFIHNRQAKEKDTSGVTPEGNINANSVTQARSKASTVEMAIEYIRELQRNLV